MEMSIIFFSWLAPFSFQGESHTLGRRQGGLSEAAALGAAREASINPRERGL